MKNIFSILALALATTALASEANVDAVDSTDASAAGPKHQMQVVTWSGNNCHGSSELGYIDHSDTRHCFNVPGGSFNSLQQKPLNGGACIMTTWSGRDCRGSSLSWANSNSCRVVPFASYSLSCCSHFNCTPKP